MDINGPVDCPTEARSVLEHFSFPQLFLPSEGMMLHKTVSSPSVQVQAAAGPFLDSHEYNELLAGACSNKPIV